MTLFASPNRRGAKGTARCWRFLAAVALAAALGCGSKSTPAVNVKPAAGAAARNVDAEVLLLLDYYDPMYKLDKEGRVINIRLGGKHLPTPVMAEVGKLTELRGIELWGANFTDDGLAQFKNLQKMDGMGLGETPLTDEGLLHLAKLKKLTHIWIPKNDKITKEGIEKLKDAAPQLNVY